MKARVKKLWREALLSGEYKQGKGKLHQKQIEGEDQFTFDDKFCCLGVLCEVAIKDGLDLEISYNKSGQASYNGEYNILPHKVMKWAGLKTKDGFFGRSNSVEREGLMLFNLTALNDQGASFKDIAAVTHKKTL